METPYPSINRLRTRQSPLRTVIETSYPPANRYRPINYLYGPLQDLIEPPTLTPILKPQTPPPTTHLPYPLKITTPID